MRKIQGRNLTPQTSATASASTAPSSASVYAPPLDTLDPALRDTLAGSARRVDRA